MQFMTENEAINSIVFKIQILTQLYLYPHME